MSKYHLLITCEHAGNSIPDEFRAYFVNHQKELEDHTGWDPGAWEIAKHLAKEFKVKPFSMHTSRLLIEPNRSLDHRQLFSAITNAFTPKQKQQLINTVYLPYRNQVEDRIRSSPKPVLHLSIHSFTPVLHQVTREVDIGLLFDPARNEESSFCSALRTNLEEAAPDLRHRFNEPYLGVDDGFTTYLRTRFPDKGYLGIEIEVNQRFASNPIPIAELLSKSISRTTG
ncbi:MAG: N-formylglutamate amidohydrolase [Cyclobacteriaceae bacterium]|nr:N-formylglutamate amidohydrolase [Cyclobacteriaceae bacterium]